MLSVLGKKTREPCVQFVTIHGGPQCEWERELLEQYTTKALYCHIRMPVLHFEDITALVDYLAQHERTGTLSSAALRMHWRIEEQPEVMDWGGVLRFIQKEMASHYPTLNFVTGGYYVSVNFVCMAYLAPTAQDTASRTSQDQYATMKELERLCDFQSISKKIENIISKTTGLACNCPLHDVSVVASRLPHTLQALSHTTASRDPADVSVIRSSLHSLASGKDGVLLVPKMLELHHSGNSLQHGLANFALQVITSAGIVLADESLETWKRMNVSVDPCIQLTTLQWEPSEYEKTSQHKEKQEETQEAPRSASSKETAEHAETSQHEDKHTTKTTNDNNNRYHTHCHPDAPRPQRGGAMANRRCLAAKVGVCN